MGTKVYMTHPDHGAMHVYSQWQIEDNIKHGWKLDVEPWIVAPTVTEEPEIVAPRRGRPPKS